MSWLRLMEQSIKEKEPATEAENGETIPLPAVRQTNKVMGLIKEMWPAYLIEIFVIILGISITLALEEWRDSSKEKRLEQIYLKNLLTDVEQDLQSLKSTSASTQKILDQGSEILTYIKNPANKDMSFSRFNADIRDILARPNFISNDATFSDLKSSGNLHLLEDIQLKNWLFAYYNQTRNIKDVQDAEQQATITLSGSYFLKQFPMDDFGNQQHSSESKALADLPISIEFGNNVLLRVTTRKELLYLYQRADSLAEQLKHELSVKTEN